MDFRLLEAVVWEVLEELVRYESVSPLVLGG